MTRTGRTAFVAVMGTVAAVSVGLFLFPDAGDDQVPRNRADAQVIRPARTSGGKSTTKKSEPAEEIWQVIYLGRSRIGYSRTTFRRITKGESVRIQSETSTHLSILRFGQPTRMSTTVRTLESANGDLLSFELESTNGKKKSRTVGQRERTHMRIETTLSGRTDRRYVEWRDGIKSPTYQDRLLRTFPMKPGEIRRYKTYDAQLGRLIEIRLAAENKRAVKLKSGRVKRLLRVRVTQSISPTEIVYSYLDDKGRPVLSESDFAGQKMVQYIVDKADALKSIQGKELDLGLKTIVRTKSLRYADERDRIVYRIQMNRDDPAKHLATNDRQQVKRINANTIELTVSRSQLPKGRTVYVRSDQKYLLASKTLDASDHRVRQHAQRAAGFQTKPVEIAIRMERYVNKRLTNKNFSTALGTASEVARNMSGDCTEHAVLLAAMLRVRRVPSRIAIGLVYDTRASGFVPHMWTEARLGEKWYPLDATRGKGMIGPGHIKLADASFSDKSDDPITSFLPLMNVLGRWRIEIRDAGRVKGRKLQTIRPKKERRGLFDRR